MSNYRDPRTNTSDGLLGTSYQDCSNLAFYVCELEFDVSAALAEFVGQPKGFEVANATTEFNVSYMAFRNAYSICVDSNDVSDSDISNLDPNNTDVLYKVDPEGITELQTAIADNIKQLHNLDIVHDDVDGRGYSIGDTDFSGNNTVGHHYARYLADSMFSNKHLVDIFNNEYEIRSSIVGTDDDVAALDSSGVTIAQKIWGTMNQADFSCRWLDLSNNWADDSSYPGRVCAPLPFMEGDQIIFNVKVSADGAQESLTRTDIPPYTFRVIITLSP